jgi:CheY-like chemotaxis protein
VLFERFRQGDSSTTRPYGGVGLGLGIVRHLVEMHGGTVVAHSDGINRGATFEVRLPRRVHDETVAEAHPPVERAPVLQGVSVLVVDDDQEALAFARSSLEQYGATVTTATTASEARTRVLETPPDVLLSDLRMPGADGLQLIREVRELDEARGRRTPAAAFTAMVRSSDRGAALAAGYQMHVAKPIEPFELAVVVEQLIRAV